MAPSKRAILDQTSEDEDEANTERASKFARLTPPLSSQPKRSAGDAGLSDGDDEDEPEDDLVDEDQDDVESGSAEAGILESVELVNFMIHTHTKVKFEPNVNFMTGRNGAGKSATLAGIIICLGGKASATDRGSSLSAFIKTGENIASAMVAIRNRGPEAYKPEVYGDTIYVERVLKRDSAASYQIKNSREKVINKTKEELDSILDYFNIQIDNAMTVLNQDTAREFMSTNDPHKKYEQFLKGTQLDVLFAVLKQASDSQLSVEHALEKRTKDLDVIRQQREDLKRKLEAQKEAAELRQKIDKLKVECAWAVVQTKQNTVEAEQSEITKLEGKRNALQEKVKKEEANIEQVDRTITQLQQEMDVKRQAVLPTQDKRRQIETELRALADERKHLKVQALEAEKALTISDDDIKRAQQNTQKEYERVNTDHSHEKRQKEQAIAALTEELRVLTEQQITSANRLAAFQTEDAQFSEERDQAYAAAQEAKRNRDDCSRKLTRLRAQKDDRSRFFGDNMSNLLREIEQKRRSFDKKVTGPLGLSIELKDPQWHWAVQTCIGREFLGAFVVHTDRDLKTLRQLLEKHTCHNRIVCNKDNEGLASDINSFEPDSSILTVMRVLRFNDPVTQQALIDCAKIERAALIKDFRDSQEFMQSRPRNVNVTFNLDGARLTMSNSGSIGVSANPMNRQQLFFGDVEQSIRDCEHELERLTEAVNDLENKHRVLQDRSKARTAAGKTLERESLQLQKEVPMKRVRLHHLQEELRTLVADSDSNNMLDSFKAEEEKLVQQRTILHKQYTALVNQIKELENKILPVKDRLQEADTQLAELKKDAEQVQTLYELRMQEKVGFGTALESAQRKLQEHKTRFDDSVAKLEASKSQVETFTVNAVDLATQLGLPTEPVHTRKTPAQIESEIKTNMRVLEQQERTHGNVAETEALFKQKSDTYKQQKHDINLLNTFNKVLAAACKTRFEKVNYFRSDLAIRSNHLFTKNLKLRNMTGKLVFDHDEQRLKLSVSKKATVQLSGGERSVTTVAFLLAIWDDMPSPFRALDEFDVCMDEVNRLMTTQMIMQAAMNNRKRQYLIISPKSMSVATSSKDFKSIINVVEVVKDRV